MNSNLRSMVTRGLSCLWMGVNQGARWALKKGWISAQRLPCRVISVGNIQAGGAGKTPLVALIALQAHQRGYTVAILSRGYRSRWEQQGGVLAPHDPPSDPEICGDEPALLQVLCPWAWIGVGAHRRKSYSGLVQRLGRNPDLVILDDGFQHWKIQKDVEIVAITGATPRERVFRENARALQAAHLLVWTKGDSLPESLWSAIESRKLCQVRYAWLSLWDQKRPSLDQDQKYWLITGIADSQSAYASALESGCQIVKHTCLSDHFAYQSENVRMFLDQAIQAGLRIALTGKDWVKWRALGIKLNEVSVFEPQLHWVQGQEIWNQILWEKQ